jgi:hypothetical protein
MASNVRTSRLARGANRSKLSAGRHKTRRSASIRWIALPDHLDWDIATISRAFPPTAAQKPVTVGQIFQGFSRELRQTATPRPRASRSRENPRGTASNDRLASSRPNRNAVELKSGVSVRERPPLPALAAAIAAADIAPRAGRAGKTVLLPPATRGAKTTRSQAWCSRHPTGSAEKESAERYPG